MSTQEKPGPGPDPTAEGLATLNEVRLRGRVAADPEERVLPSGDALCSVRLVVARDPSGARRGGGRASSDWVVCTAWTPGLRRTLGRWREGDVVAVEGALRRRHYRVGAGATSVVEIEVTGARRVRRGE